MFLPPQLEACQRLVFLLCMAISSQVLIATFRKVAENLESGADYNWGMATKCNCAHVVQSLEPTAAFTLREIRPQLDEWTEYANDYCPRSGAPIDRLVDILLEHGLSRDDIHQLEYLSNRQVLEALPGGFRYLQHGKREDVALYLRTWASLMEIELKTIANSPADLLPA